VVKGDNLPSRENLLSMDRPVADPSAIGDNALDSALTGTPAPDNAGHADQYPPATHATHGAAHFGSFASRRDAIYKRALATADTITAGMGLWLSMVMVGRDHPAVLMFAAAPLIVLLGKVIGLYDRAEWRVRKSTLDEAPRLFEVAMLFAIAIWLINGIVVTHTTDRHELVVVLVGVFLMSLVLRAFARLICRQTTPPERCLVIGDQRTCERIRTRMSGTGEMHATVVAHVMLDGSTLANETILALTTQSNLRDLAVKCDVDRIIIAPERADAAEVLNLIRTATSLGIKISVVPRLLEVVGTAAEFDDVQGVPLLSMRRVQLSRSSYYIKRALDIVSSTAALIVLSPLLGVISLAIKLDSPGRVLFRQLRIGRDGKPFEMLKFRTMVTGAHERRADLMHLNEAEGLFKIGNDPRITRVGGWLRRLSLDELPQLINVLRGEMSLVGPRPLIAEEDRRIQGWDRRRLQLTPGMTGHWQILGSSRIPLDEMVKIDYLYVTNWSLWLDVKILLRTIVYVAGRKGM
jgi:exopolysaccharide biosynthesis polyprenyl glycosylphosphotransferase